MNKKMFISSLVVLVILIGVFSFITFRKSQNKTDNANQAQNGQVAGVKTEAYFDENAPVMLFYSELCSWCQKQKLVLEELNKEGDYKVRPMNIKDNPQYWQSYEIEGTPTFIAKNGDKKVGYLDKAQLKQFLDAHR